MSERKQGSMKVAIVTGASSGIGEFTAQTLLQAGYTVYAAARRTERMKPLAAAGAKLVTLDVTSEASMLAAVQQVLSQSGRVDVLVNNAGYGSYGALEDVPLDEARRQMEVNVFGLARMTQLVLPTMRAQKSGTIVNVSSIGGKMHEPLGSWYHATKFAVEGLSDCLRMEVKPFGIRVVVIEPGAIATEWGGIAADSMEKASGHTAYAEQTVRHLKLFRGGIKSAASPQVVADAILSAVQSRNPKTRYIMGGGAKPILALRKLLPDKAFDTLMAQVLKRA
jgi:NAD(P)-dependent dehydrogenase (short-subunit alcohol dehydrogenase family)